MTPLIAETLTGLAASMADLKARVRVAVATELARAVGGAVQQVVQAVVAGRADAHRPGAAASAYRRPPADRWDDDEDDAWDRTRDSWADPDGENDHDRDVPHDAPPATPAVATAVAAGVHVARWWVSRRGTLLAGAGLGVGVGLLAVAGGPLVRCAVAVLAAAADLLAVTDALGDGAARLEHA